MSHCHVKAKDGGLPRNFMASNVAIFENDLRKWIAALATSGWTPVNLLEDAVKDEVLCFPLAKIEVDKQGKIKIFFSFPFLG